MMKWLRFTLIAISSLLLLDHFLAQIGVISGCNGDCDSLMSWLLIPAGIAALGGLTFLAHSKKDREFLIVSGISAAVSLLLILYMVSGLHKVCQLCAGFDVAVIAVFVSNFIKGRVAYLTAPICGFLFCFALLPVLDQISSQKSRNSSYEIHRYPGETYSESGWNLIVFADPNSSNCRKLIRKFCAKASSANVMIRWVITSPPTEYGRKVAAIYSGLREPHADLAYKFLDRIASSSGPLMDSEITSFADEYGIRPEVKAILSALPETGKDQVADDAKAATACHVSRVPSVFLVVNMTPDVWVISPYEP